MPLVSKQDYEQERRKKLRKKHKKMNIPKSSLDILTIKNFSNNVEPIFKDDVYSEMYKVNTVALDFINQTENNQLMGQKASLLRQFEDNIKFVSLNFHTDTTELQLRWQEYANRAEREGNSNRQRICYEQLVRLKMIAKTQINQEYFCVIYGENQEMLDKNKRTLISVASNLIYPVPLTYDEKVKIISKLNNQNIYI